MPDSNADKLMHNPSWQANPLRVWPVLRAVTAGAALLWAGAAVAQNKIAPTRTYGTETNGSTYITTLKEHPDKNFGLPTFGTRGAEMPQQKPFSSKAPAGGGETATGGAMTPGAPSPDLGMPVPGTPDPVMPGAETAGASSAPMDFFPPTTEFQLPKRNQAAASDTDTPLYTTQDNSDGTTNDDGTGTNGTGD